ncbi:MAG: hypothetical protein ACI8QC_001085 [Planctomycetota bacterium]|jgi:hypothetical protein
MSSSLDAARVALSSLRSALEQSGTQGRDAFFEGREHLRDAKRVLDSEEGRHLLPLVETMRFFLDQLLRGDGLSAEAATEGLLLLTDSLSELTQRESIPKRNALALDYLVGTSAAAPAQKEAPALRAGPKRIPPSLSAAKVGQLLSGYDRMSRSSIGQILLRQGAIDTAELDRALALQQMSSRKLGEVLVAMEVLGIETLNNALERQRMETGTPLREHNPLNPVQLSPRRKTGS